MVGATIASGPQGKLSQGVLHGEPMQADPAVNVIDPFLALRGLACLAVLVAHCGHLTARNALVVNGHNLSWLLLPDASAAVIVFFTLSGYLMGKLFYTNKYSLSREGLARFWKNRALRICPLYYSLVLLVGLFAYTQVFKPENFAVLVQVLTFSYGDFTRDIFSAQFWSISTEMQFYFVVPLIVLLMRKYIRSLPAVALAFACSLAAVELYKQLAFHCCFVQGAVVESRYMAFVYSALPANMDAFIIGLLVNPLRSCFPARANVISSRRSRALTTLGWLLVLSCSLVNANLHFHTTARNATEFTVIPLIAALSTGLFIWMMESRGDIRQTKLNAAAIAANPARLLDVLGVLSYGIYLWHFCIINRVHLLVPAGQPLPYFLGVTSLVFAFSVAVASVTYVGIERPCNRYRKKDAKISEHRVTELVLEK